MYASSAMATVWCRILKKDASQTPPPPPPLNGIGGAERVTGGGTILEAGQPILEARAGIRTFLFVIAMSPRNTTSQKQ